MTIKQSSLHAVFSDTFHGEDTFHGYKFGQNARRHEHAGAHHAAAARMTALKIGLALLLTALAAAPFFASAQTMTAQGTVVTNSAHYFNLLRQVNAATVISGPSAAAPTSMTVSKFDLFSYPFYQQYTVNIGTNTQILNVSRGAMALSQLTAGDRVNIYGYVRASSIDALIIRDLNAWQTPTVPATPSIPGCPFGAIYNIYTGQLCSASPSTVCPPGALYNSMTGQPCSTNPTWPNPHTLSITPVNALQATVGAYGSIGFRISGGNSANAYIINTGSSQSIPGLTFTRTPCAPGMFCSQAENRDTVYLTGTPTQAGTYTVTIRAEDNPPLPPCATPAYPGAPICMIAVAKTFGSASFTITVNGSGNATTTPGNSAPVITSVNGPTGLGVNQTGTWTVTAQDADGGSLTYSVRFGDEAANASPATVSSASSFNATTGTFSHTYMNRGTYTLWFTVTDSTNRSVTSSMTVNVY